MLSESGFRPVSGVDYPTSTGEFLAWFGTDAACLDYLDWLRWPDGFACARCQRLADERRPLLLLRL